MINFVEVVPKLDAILSRGLCQGVGNRDGIMCVEEAICAALGMPHGDDPGCVSSSVRAFETYLNDAEWSSEKARAIGLRDLSIAQLGSLGVIDNQTFALKLAIETTQQIIPKLLRAILPEDKKFIKAANSCERWAARTTEATVRAAEAAARAATAAGVVEATDAAVWAAEAATWAAEAARAAAWAAEAARITATTARATAQVTATEARVAAWAAEAAGWAAEATQAAAQAAARVARAAEAARAAAWAAERTEAADWIGRRAEWAAQVARAAQVAAAKEAAEARVAWTTEAAEAWTVWAVEATVQVVEWATKAAAEEAQRMPSPQTKPDEFLLLSAEIALSILKDLKSPGCEWI